MADKNVNMEVETEETVNEQEMDFEQIPEEDTIVIEKKKGLPKWMVKTGKIVETGLAIFGGLTVALLVYDGHKSRKAKKNYIEAAQRQQISDTSASILNDELKI